MEQARTTPPAITRPSANVRVSRRQSEYTYDDASVAAVPRRLSGHALVRMQQRGICHSDLRIAVRYGQSMYWYHGAKLAYMGRRQVTRAIEDGLAEAQMADRLRGIAVIVSPDGVVLTAYRNRRGPRAIARSTRCRCHRACAV